MLQITSKKVCRIYGTSIYGVLAELIAYTRTTLERIPGDDEYLNELKTMSDDDFEKVIIHSTDTKDMMDLELDENMER